MDKAKIFQFKILNQLRIKETSITCVKCHNWLNGEIYIHSDCKVYCASCSTDEEDRRRNEVQEDMLQNLLFPCKYQDCNFILKRVEITDHYTKCMYAPVQCGLCNESIVNQIDLTTHFEKEHQDITTSIALTEPVLTVNVEKAKTKEVYICTFQQRTFLILFCRNESTVKVEVAKPNDDKNIHEDNAFTVLYTSNQREYSFRKFFINYSNICMNANDDADFLVKDDEPINLQVKLFNASGVISIPECPICMHVLTLEMAQCGNGHNLCIDCGEKIDTCATCQNTSKSIVKLHHFLASMSVMCPNFEKGCLAIIVAGDFNTHVRNCLFKTVTCPESECNIEYLKYQLSSHFKEEQHTISFGYEYRITNGITLNLTTYCNFKFKSKLFCCYKEVIGRGDRSTIAFYVQVLHCEDIAEAEKFKFEIHIHDKNMNDPIAKLILTGLCNTASNTNHQTSILYNTCVKFFYKRGKDDKEPTIGYRCIIRDR